MAVLDTKKVIYLLTENCKSRRSCVGCDMSGKYSLKDTCLLHELKQSVKQSTLQETRPQTPFEKQEQRGNCDDILSIMGYM